MPQPDPLPESITLGSFKGLKNTVTRERLTAEDLERALNVDLDDAGQLHRRRGQTLRIAGSFHSPFNTGTMALVVRDQWLGALAPDLSFTYIADGGVDRVSYTQVADTTYYSSRTVSGKIDRDGARTPWGSQDDAVWLSPVLSPTETLGAIRGRLLEGPPQATEIEAYAGRIYMAYERTVWATELFALDFVDKTRNYLQFEAGVTMLGAVNDGIYVGTDSSLSFLKGNLSEGFKPITISNSPVLAGSMVRVPADRVHPNARTGGQVPASQALVFMTMDGLYAAFDNGEAYNLTQGRVVFPRAVRGAALFREQDGVSQYLAVADSAGGPSSTTRIGDFLDAEIRRSFQKVAGREDRLVLGDTLTATVVHA